MKTVMSDYNAEHYCLSGIWATLYSKRRRKDDQFSISATLC